jgi:hypothetical protein
MTQIKNMAYWRAKNTLPGINPNSEGNTDTPDGKSGSSPLQDNSVEEQIAAANKMFGSGVTVAPKTKTDPGGTGKQPPGVDELARKAMHNLYSLGGSYKGHTSYTQLPFTEKQKLRDKAFDYQKSKKSK